MIRLLTCILLFALILPSIGQESMTNAGGSSLVLYIGNTTVHCDGDFTNGSSGNLSFIGSGTPNLEVDGDYTIDAASTFTVGFSDIELTGSSLQYFSSGGKTNYDVTINNSSGGVALLANDLTVSNQLDFQSGHLTLASQDAIIQSTGSIQNASNAAFIVAASNGLLTIQSVGGAGTHTGSVEFPVGYSPISTAYCPMNINNDPGTAGDFSVKVDDDVLQSGTSGSAVTTYVVDRTWHVSTNSAGPNYSFKGTWHSSQEIGSFRNIACYVSYWDSGTDWNAFDSEAAATDEGGGYYSRTSSGGQTLTSKPIAIASNDILPVELLSFEVEREDRTGVLEWTTASEINNEEFEIEHSLDGVEFEFIGSVLGAGTSTEMNAYEYFHNDLENGVHYYRLKQIDFDGQFEYSDVQTVSLNEAITKTSIYPNPAKNFIQINFSSEERGMFEYKVYAESGQVIYDGVAVSIDNATNSVYLNIETWARGKYFIHLKSPSGQYLSESFIRQ